jgi:hypothetical protein
LTSSAALKEVPLTAADVLFGRSADATEALTRQIMSAGRGQNLGQSLKHLPRVTREAAAREAAAAAAGLLKVDLIEVLAAGWREHHDLISAARRTLDTPGSKELVGVAAHRITTLQQPAVSILLDGRRVHTLQLGLSIVFEVTGLVAGVSLGRLVGIHAGRCEIGVALTVHEIEVLTKRAHHIELPGVKALKSGFRLLPASQYPSSEHAGDHHPGGEQQASGFPGVELMDHHVAGGQVPVTQHASSQAGGGEHYGSQAGGGEHYGRQADDEEHPSSGGADHPAASGAAPWWENAEPVPPPSHSP